MAQFGWAHLSGAVRGTGPSKSVQFLQSENGELTGSSNFTYNVVDNELFVTGSLIVSGTVYASTLDVIQTTKSEIFISGSTSFGDDYSDLHERTGSVHIYSGSFAQGYRKLETTPYTATAHDTIIGVSSSAYTSITLPGASSSAPGRIIIIKDEWSETRTEANPIGVSASAPETIDHVANYSITGDNVALSLYSDGISRWFIY